MKGTHPRSRAAVVVFLLGAVAIACGGPTQASSAAKVLFMVQPGNAIAGDAIAAAVAVQDASGNTVTSATSAVTVAIGANPGGGTLSGTTTVNAVNGVASFPALSINKAGGGYTLVASSGALTSATSAPFSVAPGPVASVWVNPGAAVLSFPSGPGSVQLSAVPLDTNGNTVPTNITWTTSDPNVGTVDAEGLVVLVGVGVATIHGSTGGRVGTATIAVSCVPPRCSRPFELTFSQQPTTTAAGATLSPPVQVSIGSTGSSGAEGVLSLAIGYNTGNGTLTGNTDVPVSGYPTTTWNNLSIDRPGTYTLVAIVKSTGNAWGITSAAFNITQ